MYIITADQNFFEWLFEQWLIILLSLHLRQGSGIDAVPTQVKRLLRERRMAQQCKRNIAGALQYEKIRKNRRAMLIQHEEVLTLFICQAEKYIVRSLYLITDDEKWISAFVQRLQLKATVYKWDNEPPVTPNWHIIEAHLYGFFQMSDFESLRGRKRKQNAEKERMDEVA